MLLPHPSDTSLVQSDHYSCSDSQRMTPKEELHVHCSSAAWCWGTWSGGHGGDEHMVGHNDLSDLSQPNDPMIVWSPDPSTMQVGESAVLKGFLFRDPGKYTVPSQLVWGRQGEQGAVPVFVECSQGKSIGEEIKPYFLKAYNVTPSTARRNEAKQGSEEKTLRPCSFCEAESRQQKHCM